MGSYITGTVVAACMVLGVEPALALVEATKGLEVLLVDDAAQVHRSTGWAAGVERGPAPVTD